MNVLGITSGGDSGAALFKNEELVLAVNEERLSRKKLDDSYPQLSISWCLKEAGLVSEDIDLICYGFTNGIGQGPFLEKILNRLYEYSEDRKCLKIITNRLGTEAAIDAAKKKEFEEETSKIFADTPIYFCNHHEAHQASAYMTSPFKKALVVTADGRGDFKSLTVCTAGSEGILERYYTYSWESLGYFYGRITSLCGFIPNRQEGKIVGLAAHGHPQTAKTLMKRMIDLDGDEKIRSFPGDLFTPFFTNYSELLQKEAGQFSREDLAAAAQDHIETIMCSIISKHARETGIKDVCVGGGVFANVKMNQRIRELPEVRDIYIYPNMGDGGICAGAVYHKMLNVDHAPSRPLNSLYLGPQVTPDEIIEKFNGSDVVVKKPANLHDTIIELLSEKQVVGLVQGRTEFGPRSLGNRSMLATCDSSNFCDSINARLGRTEFMPFAPAVASNLAHICFVNYKEQFSSRHMTITYDVTSEFAKNSPAVVHIDNTARPQIVFKEDNRFLYDLLNHWHQKTGRLCLLNTSFNLHEDPIISTADDIVYTFKKGAVDYLLFPPYIAKYPKKIKQG